MSFRPSAAMHAPAPCPNVHGAHTPVSTHTLCDTESCVSPRLSVPGPTTRPSLHTAPPHPHTQHDHVLDIIFRSWSRLTAPDKGRCRSLFWHTVAPPGDHHRWGTRSLSKRAQSSGTRLKDEGSGNTTQPVIAS